MKLSGLYVVATLSLLATAPVRAGQDATAPVDYTQRNSAFAPAATVTPEKKELPRDATVQDKRFDKTVIDKTTSPLGDRRAPVKVEETRDKVIRDKDSHRPEKIDEPMNAFNHREAAITTAADTKKPPTVSKYQDSLSAASASNMARFPALDHATSAKINRFVFKKNPSPVAPLTGDAPVTHAASGDSAGDATRSPVAAPLPAPLK